jgi:hypothetical protein
MRDAKLFIILLVVHELTEVGGKKLTSTNNNAYKIP